MTDNMHRPEAFNCIYWTGDRSPVYFGTCPVCDGRGRPPRVGDPMNGRVRARREHRRWGQFWNWFWRTIQRENR